MSYNMLYVCIFVIGVKSSNWDTYIDRLIAQSKDATGTAQVDKVCIIRLDNGSLLTSAKHPHALLLSPKEAIFIAQGFKADKYTDGSFWTTTIQLYILPTSLEEAVLIKEDVRGENHIFVSEGIHAEGIKYSFLREESLSVIAKNRQHGTLLLGPTKTIVVIAHSPSGGLSCKARKAPEVITDVLKSLGI